MRRLLLLAPCLALVLPACDGDDATTPGGSGGSAASGGAATGGSVATGGSGAVGHAFEPGVEGLIQSDFLLANLLRDDDEDGVGDMTLAEAAFTAMPFLSWAEVVLGDPLMRLRTASGGPVDPDGDGVPLPAGGGRMSERSRPGWAGPMAPNR